MLKYTFHSVYINVCIVMFQAQSERKRLLSYEPEQIVRAYEMWKEDGVSIRRAAILCSVPLITLHERTTGRINPYKPRCPYNRLLSYAEEAAFVAHVKAVAACGYGYTRRELALLASETAFFLNKRETSFPVHDTWVTKLLKRRP